jgi:hypothetical protein
MIMTLYLVFICVKVGGEGRRGMVVMVGMIMIMTVWRVVIMATSTIVD